MKYHLHSFGQFLKKKKVLSQNQSQRQNQPKTEKKII